MSTLEVLLFGKNHVLAMDSANNRRNTLVPTKRFIKMIRKKLLFFAMAISGVLLLILPSLIFPTPFLKQLTYFNRIEFAWQHPMQRLFAFAWTTTPFTCLALIAYFRLRRPFDDIYHYVSWCSGIVSAYFSSFVLGFVIFIPQDGGGVNFGAALFPFWAVLSMPIAYAIGWTIGGYAYRLYLYWKRHER